jgi:hypothetical protein
VAVWDEQAAHSPDGRRNDPMNVSKKRNCLSLLSRSTMPGTSAPPELKIIPVLGSKMSEKSLGINLSKDF